MNRILRHVNSNDFRRVFHKKLSEENKLAKIKLKEWEEEKNIRKELEELLEPLKVNWREELEKNDVFNEGMTTAGLVSITLPAEGDTDLETIDSTRPDSFNSAAGLDALNGVSIKPNGTGSGETGGFDIGQSYLGFDGSASSRHAILDPVDSSQFDTMSIRAIVGNDSNGGEDPDVAGEELRLYYMEPGGSSFKSITIDPRGDQILSADADIIIALGAGNGALQNFSISLPSYARGNGVTFMLYQASNSGRTKDHYGITNLNYQRRSPRNVFVSLDSPEASAFIRTDPIMKGLSAEERRKKLENMLDASNEYMLKSLGMVQKKVEFSDTGAVNGAAAGTNQSWDDNEDSTSYDVTKDGISSFNPNSDSDPDSDSNFFKTFDTFNTASTQNNNNPSDTSDSDSNLDPNTEPLSLASDNAKKAALSLYTGKSGAWMGGAIGAASESDLEKVFGGTTAKIPYLKNQVDIIKSVDEKLEKLSKQMGNKELFEKLLQQKYKAQDAIKAEIDKAILSYKSPSDTDSSDDSNTADTQEPTEVPFVKDTVKKLLSSGPKSLSAEELSVFINNMPQLYKDYSYSYSTYSAGKYFGVGDFTEILAGSMTDSEFSELIDNNLKKLNTTYQQNSVSWNKKYYDKLMIGVYSDYLSSILNSKSGAKIEKPDQTSAAKIEKDATDSATLAAFQQQKKKKKGKGGEKDYGNIAQVPPGYAAPHSNIKFDKQMKQYVPDNTNADQILLDKIKKAKKGKGGDIQIAGVGPYGPGNEAPTNYGDPNNIQWPKDKYKNKKAPPGPGVKTASYEPIGKVLSEKKKLKSVGEVANKIPGYYDGKPSVLGFPDNPPPEMVNGMHPDLVTPEGQKKQAKRYNRLDPQSARAMPPTANPYIDKIVRAAAKKPK